MLELANMIQHIFVRLTSQHYFAMQQCVCKIQSVSTGFEIGHYRHNGTKPGNISVETRLHHQSAVC